MIPASDYLHLWKCYSNKIKNHPVTLRPDSSERAIDCDTLNTILALGPALLDKSPIGRMRDSCICCHGHCKKRLCAVRICLEKTAL
jgi:hypothetical protein